MDSKVLKKRSSQLFTYIAVAASCNLVAFMASAMYMLAAKKKLQNSGIKDLDPTGYEEQMSRIHLFTTIGFSVAILFLIICVILATKRVNVAKKLEKAEAEELDELDIK